MTQRIEIDLRLTVSDGRRRFALSAALATDAAFVALYGPSGAGKSLTLQAIAGLLRPEAGHVRVHGQTLFDRAAGIDLPAAQRGIGYLFQDYALFPHLSVRQNLSFGLTSWRQRRLSDEQQVQIDALLQSFGLAAMADSRPASLSGGQRQRVALARALACQPRLLLLDEPFAALNPMLRAELREELGALCRRTGMSALMVTHDVDDVLALADVAYVYDEGQVVRQVDLQAATQTELYESLTGVPALPVTPRRQALRQLLLGQGAGSSVMKLSRKLK